MSAGERVGAGTDPVDPLGGHELADLEHLARLDRPRRGGSSRQGRDERAKVADECLRPLWAGEDGLGWVGRGERVRDVSGVSSTRQLEKEAAVLSDGTL